MTLRNLTSAAVLMGVGVWIATLALYLATLAPTLSWGHDKTAMDGGELLAAANTLGIPHPPGYPTYTLLLKAFATLVPIGDFAHRGNLLSALLASGAVATLYCVILRFCRYVRPEGPAPFWIASAALGATVFATSPLFWSQSTVAEVYALNTLFVGALLLLASQVALRVPADRRQDGAYTVRRMALFAFLLGLGLGNHLTLLAVAVPLVLWLWATIGWRRVFSPWTAGALVAGLAIYVYLPIRAAQDPPIN